MPKCVIVGAGPAGLNAALYLKRAGIDVSIIEKNIPGGEMLKTNKIENYLGFSEIDGGDLALKMSAQVKKIGVPIIKDEVLNITKKKKFEIVTKKGTIQADYVIVATGRTPRKLGVLGEDDMLNRGISYCAVCDGAFYRGLDVAVVGGGDSALTEALYLADLCNKVYVLVRKDVRANEILQNRVKAKKNIVLLKNVQVSALNYSDKLSQVILSDGNKLDISGMFIAIGGIPKLDFLANLDLNLKNGYIKTNDNMESSVKGLYAAGDVRDKDFYQIITAASDGAIAALSIKEDV